MQTVFNRLNPVSIQVLRCLNGNVKTAETLLKHLRSLNSAPVDQRISPGRKRTV